MFSFYLTSNKPRANILHSTHRDPSILQQDEVDIALAPLVTTKTYMTRLGVDKVKPKEWYRFWNIGIRL